MALVANGKLSLGDISQEFGYPLSTPITLQLRNSDVNKQVYINNSWINLNPCSTFQPDVIAPHSITEWYKYDHNELCSTTTTTSPPCTPITNFSYTINGIVDGNSFTLAGRQDINISFNSYSPNGYGTPLEYEYILDTSTTGISSNSTKNFPNLSLGDHTLIIKVYNCNRANVVKKTIQFKIIHNTTTTTTTTSPVCVSVTDFSYKINGVDDGNGFTIGGGQQDINISFNSYSPNGYSNPLQYKYILDNSITDGIVNSSTKTFVGVNVGTHSLTIEVYNCGSLRVSKTFEFTINDNTTTTSTTTSTSTTSTTQPPSTCVPITGFNIYAPYYGDVGLNYIAQIKDFIGTAPYLFKYELYNQYGAKVSTLITNDAYFIWLFNNCSDVGQWALDVTVYNCDNNIYSHLNSITITIYAPNLQAPLLAACKYLDNDGVLRGSLLAYGYNSAAILKVYKAYNDEYIGDMTDGIYSNILIYSNTVQDFYIKQYLCGYVSGRSNQASVYFAMSSC